MPENFKDICQKLTIACKLQLGVYMQKYHSNDIDDLYAYKTNILNKILKIIDTFYVVCEECHDTITSAAIMRTIVDNLALYNLIYHEKSHDEILLRHYLFILDGIEQKANYYDTIMEGSYLSLLKNKNMAIHCQVENDIENLQTARTVCLQRIKLLPIYFQHQQLIENLLIKHHLWNYKNINTNNCKRNEYRWTDMQSLLSRDFSAVIAKGCYFLSQYVHGLSISNLHPPKAKALITHYYAIIILIY